MILKSRDYSSAITKKQRHWTDIDRELTMNLRGCVLVNYHKQREIKKVREGGKCLVIHNHRSDDLNISREG